LGKSRNGFSDYSAIYMDFNCPENFSTKRLYCLMIFIYFYVRLFLFEKKKKEDDNKRNLVNLIMIFFGEKIKKSLNFLLV